MVGIDGFAVYGILGALSIWLSLLNLSIPVALQNLISEYRAKGFDTTEIKNVACSLLLIVLIILIPIIYFLSFFVRDIFLWRYDFLSRPTLFYILILMLFSAINNIFIQVLYAEFKSLLASLYTTINALLVSVILFIIDKIGVKDFNVIIILYFMPILFISISGVVQTKLFLKWNFNRNIALIIINRSKGLLLFSFLSASTLAVDYFVISILLNSIDIVQYNIYSRIFMLILTVHGVLLAIEWPKISELIHSNLFEKARKKVFRILYLGSWLTVIGSIFIIVLIEDILILLTGSIVQGISYPLIITLAIYMLIRIWCDTFSVGLLSVGETGSINKYIPFQAVISIFCQYIFTKFFGVSGIVLGLILSFLLTAAWINPLKFFELTKVTK